MPGKSIDELMLEIDMATLLGGGFRRHLLFAHEQGLLVQALQDAGLDQLYPLAPGQPQKLSSEWEYLRPRREGRMEPGRGVEPLT